MKLPIKIILINLAAVFVITLLIALSSGSVRSNDFAIGLGLCCLAIGLLDLFISLILFLTGKQNYEAAKGFLLSGGILILGGFAVCSSTTISFH
jgi:hypothetical protein